MWACAASRTFVERGDPIQVDAIVIDLDGKVVVDTPITVRAVRLKWKYVKGEWQEIEVDEQLCNVASAADPVRCTFETPEGGTYRITATIADDAGSPQRHADHPLGERRAAPHGPRVEQEEVTLIPDREEYQPGDTAEILVQAPFTPAEGLLTVRRDGPGAQRALHA